MCSQLYVHTPKHSHFCTHVQHSPHSHTYPVCICAVLLCAHKCSCTLPPVHTFAHSHIILCTPSGKLFPTASHSVCTHVQYVLHVVTAVQTHSHMLTPLHTRKILCTLGYTCTVSPTASHLVRTHVHYSCECSQSGVRVHTNILTLLHTHEQYSSFSSTCTLPHTLTFRLPRHSTLACAHRCTFTLSHVHAQ